jgi:hypothetical protein
MRFFRVQNSAQDLVSSITSILRRGNKVMKRGGRKRASCPRQRSEKGVEKARKMEVRRREGREGETKKGPIPIMPTAVHETTCARGKSGSWIRIEAEMRRRIWKERTNLSRRVQGT